MIQRLNFIEKESFQITYGTIFYTFLGAAILCLLTYGILFLSQIQAKASQDALTLEIAHLKQERERLLSKEETLQGSSPFMEIRQNLEKQPSWSHLLQAIASSLPPNVWLVNVKTFDKEDSPSKRGTLLNGRAKNPQGLSSFLSALEDTSYFEKVVLTTSKEEAGAFNFSASCDISVMQTR